MTNNPPIQTFAIPLPWSSFDANHPSKVGEAVRQIGVIVSDGEWHPWHAVMTEVISSTGLLPKTVNGLLGGMVRTGGLERRGKYDQRAKRDKTFDKRKVRLSSPARSSR